MDKLELYGRIFNREFPTMQSVFTEVLNTEVLNTFYDTAISELSIATGLFPNSRIEKKLQDSHKVIGPILRKVSAENDTYFEFQDLLYYVLGFDLKHNIEKSLEMARSYGITANRNLYRTFYKDIQYPYLFRSLNLLNEEYHEFFEFPDIYIDEGNQRITISVNYIIADIIYEYGEMKYEEFSKSKMSSTFQEIIREEFEESYLYNKPRTLFKGHPSGDIIGIDKYDIKTFNSVYDFELILEKIESLRFDLRVALRDVITSYKLFNCLHLAKIAYCNLARAVIENNSYPLYVRLVKCAHQIRIIEGKLSPI